MTTPTYHQAKASIYRYRKKHLQENRNYHRNYMKNYRNWNKVRFIYLAILLDD